MSKMFDQLATKIKRKEASLIYRLKTTYDMINAIGEIYDPIGVINYINEGKYYFRDQFIPNKDSPVDDLFKIVLLPVIPFV